MLHSHHGAWNSRIPILVMVHHHVPLKFPKLTSRVSMGIQGAYVPNSRHAIPRRRQQQSVLGSIFGCHWSQWSMGQSDWKWMEMATRARTFATEFLGPKDVQIWTHMITISGYKPRRWNLWAAEYGNCWEKSFGVSSFIDSPRICPASNTNTISVRTVWGIAPAFRPKTSASFDDA